MTHYKNKTSIVNERVEAVDPETGEVYIKEQKVQKNISIKVKSYDEFLQVYAESLAVLADIANNPSAIKTLVYILQNTRIVEKKDDCSMITSPTWRKLCADKMKIDPKTVTRSLTILEEKGLLRKGKLKDLYYLNPTYFFKGGLDTRAQLIQVFDIKLETEES